MNISHDHRDRGPQERENRPLGMQTRQQHVPPGLSSILGPQSLRELVMELSLTLCEGHKLGGLVPHYVVAVPPLFDKAARLQPVMPPEVAAAYSAIDSHIDKLIASDPDSSGLVRAISNFAFDSAGQELVKNRAQHGTMPGEVMLCPKALLEIILAEPQDRKTLKIELVSEIARAYVDSLTRPELDDSELFWRVEGKHPEFPRLVAVRRYLTSVLTKQPDNTTPDDVQVILNNSLQTYGWTATCQQLLRNIEEDLSYGACNLLRGFEGWGKRMQIERYGCGGTSWIQEI